jgi:hypothetical protein
MKSLFKEVTLECFLDEEARVLFHIWYGKPSSYNFRESLMRIYDEYMIHKKEFDTPLHWLADTQSLGVVSIDDQGWLEKVWNETLFVKAGVKTHAVIIGSDVFAKHAMEKFKKSMQQKYANKNLYLETFPNKDSAYKWFKSIEEKWKENS